MVYLYYLKTGAKHSLNAAIFYLFIFCFKLSSGLFARIDVQPVSHYLFILFAIVQVKQNVSNHFEW